MTAVYAARIPEVMLYPLPDENGRLRFSPGDLDRIAQRADAILIGNGLGVTDALRETLAYLFRQYTGTLVVDADGLNALAGMSDMTGALYADPYAAHRRTVPADRRHGGRDGRRRAAGRSSRLRGGRKVGVYGRHRRKRHVPQPFRLCGNGQGRQRRRVGWHRDGSCGAWRAAGRRGHRLLPVRTGRRSRGGRIWQRSVFGHANFEQVAFSASIGLTPPRETGIMKLLPTTAFTLLAFPEES